MVNIQLSFYLDIKVEISLVLRWKKETLYSGLPGGVTPPDEAVHAEGTEGSELGSNNTRAVTKYIPQFHLLLEFYFLK